ncbi:hypothetical protein DENSPDRAFT_927379 [Dentipellis sp. KUC8613]|nr:hypothetical protein DENSPDRAFT_927379 [Dentipellis sp. KUC8613]
MQAQTHAQNNSSPSPVHSAWASLADARLTNAKAVTSVPRDREETQAALQQIDDELAALARAVAFIRTRQNTLLPVTRLPVEALSRIFMWEAILEPPLSSHTWYSHWNTGQYEPSQTSAKLGWIKVTHVCRHWREVALNNPRLWTAMQLKSAALTRVMLERSRNLGIVIRVDAHSSDQELSVEKVVASAASFREHASRIRLLDLKTYPKMGTAILDVLSGPALLLESVRIICDRADPDDRAPKDEDDEEDDNDFIKRSVDKKGVPLLDSRRFGGQTPRLRRLVLHQTRVAWDSPILLSGLTHLEIRLPAECMASRDPTSTSATSKSGRPRWLPTHAQLMSVLGTTPHLTTLVLQRSVPEYEEALTSWARQSLTTGPPGPRLSLPHLRLIELDGGFFPSAHLLACLAIPPTASLLISTRSHPVAPADHNSADVLAKYMFPASQAMRLRSLHINLQSTSLLVEGWPAALGIPIWSFDPYLDWDRSPPPPAPFSFTFLKSKAASKRTAHSASVWDERKILAAVLSTLNTCTVEDLRVCHAGAEPASDAYWWAVFGEMRGVRVLKVSDGSAKALAPVLVGGVLGQSITASRYEPRNADDTRRGAAARESLTVATPMAQTPPAVLALPPKPPTLLFPALRTLVLVKVSIGGGNRNRNRNRKKQGAGQQQGIAFHDALKELLLLRRRWRAPVEHLRIEACAVSKSWVAELEGSGLVRKVEWDRT